MKTSISHAAILLALLVFQSCEEDVTPDPSEFKARYVVESYVEKSGDALPPYVILTRSIGFYSRLDTGVLNRLFVHGADVRVKHKEVWYRLDEFCLGQVPEPLRTEVLKSLGLNPDSLVVDFCAYVDISGKIPLESEGVYDLEIIAGSDTLRSRCAVPAYVPLDSLWFTDVPGAVNDSFAQLFCIIQDMPSFSNYYRYFTAGPKEPLAANLRSVTNDFFFDGQRFKFVLTKAQEPGSGFSDTTGYYRRGDSITIKWCNIDPAMYEFWNTLEVSRTRQGPFSSYVRIKGNVDKALGVFGGQQCGLYKIFVPVK